MMPVARHDLSLIGRWWWEVDRYSLIALAALIVVGVVLMLSASPSVAERIGVDPLHFIRRHALFLAPSAAVLLAVSMMPPKYIRRLALLTLVLSIVMLVMTLVSGNQIKGASRWLSVGGFSIQPSEFAKPAFAVVAAALFQAGITGNGIPGRRLATGLYALLLALILIQPDVGQSAVLTTIWLSQLFLSGIPFVLLPLLITLVASGSIAAYLLFPHVQKRVDGFLNPGTVDSYQTDRAMDSFGNGGMWGVGIGEGTEKARLPDSHTDFIFAVAGEEMGLIICLAIVATYAFILLRSVNRAARSGDMFVILAAMGLLTQFTVQALVNIGSTTAMLPTTGMTLPFISYGGSSLLSLSLGMGMLLALTRVEKGRNQWPN